MKRVVGFICLWCALISIIPSASAQGQVVDSVADSDSVVAMSIKLETDSLLTVTVPKHRISGQIEHYDIRKKAQIELYDVGQDRYIKVKVDSYGYFTHSVKLNKGVNYFDLILSSKEEQLLSFPLIIYYGDPLRKSTDKLDAPTIVWLGQFSGGAALTDDQSVLTIVDEVKKAGFTAIALDVRGVEGYVSYRKNDLSGTPYFNQTKNSERVVVQDQFDLLQSLIQATDSIGLKIYAGFNFFVEGSITARDCALGDSVVALDEVIVQHPLDRGRVVALGQSAAGVSAYQKGNELVLAFTNAASEKVQDFELLRLEEVLKNYQIDGVIVERGRYGDLYSDFSEVSRAGFEKYLAQRGKKLDSFPSDAFLIDSVGGMVEGEFFAEWIASRSHTIKDFFGRVRSLVDRYKVEKQQSIELASYVGQWYDRYCEVGVNWASPDFYYDQRLDFRHSLIYNSDYAQTSYLDLLDFLIVGLTESSPEELLRTMTKINILTQAKRPIFTAVNLAQYDASVRARLFNLSVLNSRGLMLFDLMQIESWQTIADLLDRVFER